MKLCIIDPGCHVPTLKTLFPEAEYFAHEPDNFFKFVTTQHYTRSQNYKEEGFMYNTDWNKINSKDFNTLFIVAPLLDYYNPISKELILYTFNMREKIKNIINSNSFEKIALFDVYDYDYDPNEINTDWKVDIYFKRNYNRTKFYKSNVVPFPFIMFLKPCVMKTVINCKPAVTTGRINAAFWVGGLYKHINALNGSTIDRISIYNEIRNVIVSKHQLSFNDYIDHLQKYKIGIDLAGVGDPNKRTFEIIANGSLLMSMNNLNWGFKDEFDPDTIFTTGDEFKIKLHKLLTDEIHYKKCMDKQNELVKKYFNKNWLREYIENKLL